MSSKEKKQSLSLMMSLPEEIIVDIIARVPRCYYSKLSLVSKRLRSLVTSPELYARRSLLGCTEHCPYVAVYNKDNENRLYILHRKANNNGFCLALVQSLPKMPYHGTFVAVGPKIYVFGPLHEALSVDCRSHTVQLLPDLPMPITHKSVAFIDGKIYVIGRLGSGIRVMMLDTETRMWKSKRTEPDVSIHDLYPGCAVIADKMFMSDSRNNIVYRPKDSKWEVVGMRNLWEVVGMRNSEAWQYGCVVDEVLYNYNYQDNMLKAYDPYERCWRVVKGVKKLLPKGRYAHWSSQTVSYGTGRLVVVLPVSYDSSILAVTREIWCAEIVLERRGQRGEIWGKVEWCDVVINGQFTAIKSLDVMNLLGAGSIPDALGGFRLSGLTSCHLGQVTSS